MLGAENFPVRSAASLPQLLAHWSETFALPQFRALTSFDVEALTLRYEDARQGRGWTLDGGRILLRREGDDLRAGAGFAVLSGGDYASTFDADYAMRIGSQAARFSLAVHDVQARDIAVQSVALGWLEVLRAPISGGLRGSVDEQGGLGPLEAVLEIGAGVLQPDEQTPPVAFSSARSEFTYLPDEQTLFFDRLSLTSDWGSGELSGRAHLEGIADWRLDGLTGQFAFGELSLSPGHLYEQPVRLDGGSADFRLELHPFRITLGQMTVAEDTSRIHLSGRLATGDRGWRLALDAHADELSPARLVELWPSALAGKPRAWLAENLGAGTLRNIDLALRAVPGRKPDLYADFAFEDAMVQFMRTMPPLVGAAGQGVLSDHRLAITADRGRVEAGEGREVDAAGTSFIIPDTTIRKEAPAEVRLNLSGSVPAMLSLLDRPPVRALRATDLPEDFAEGRAEVTAALYLPLKKGVQPVEVTFDLDGTIRNAESSRLVPDQRLAFPLLRVSGDQGAIAISGSGTINEVPIDVRWDQALGKAASKGSRASGRVELSQRLLDSFAISLPSGFFSGRGSGEFTLDFARAEPPRLGLRSDLSGIRLALPQLGWTKPEATAGNLSLSARLGPEPRVDRLDLAAAGLTASGALVPAKGGGLERALFSALRIGEWLDVSAELTGNGPGKPMDARILGGTLDLRRAKLGTGGGGIGTGAAEAPAGGGTLEATLDRVQVNDQIALTGLQGKFGLEGGLAGTFAARVNDGTGIAGRIVPRDGRSAVRLQSQDAGGVLRSAGLLTQGRGGVFDMTLLPAGEAGQFDGSLRISDISVTRAPALAALLGALSVVGLFDELSGRGIRFSEVEAEFRLTPTLLTLYSASAVGPSLGLSMDGTYDLAARWFDMRGAVSPIYMLNQVGSFMTRKGEGVFGFNYALEGPSSAPRVRVNPLSVLMPGVLRDLIRPDPPVPD